MTWLEDLRLGRALRRLERNGWNWLLHDSWATDGSPGLPITICLVRRRPDSSATAPHGALGRPFVAPTVREAVEKALAHVESEKKRRGG